jgi:hypothetical protein
MSLKKFFGFLFDSFCLTFVQKCLFEFLLCGWVSKSKQKAKQIAFQYLLTMEQNTESSLKDDPE